MLCGYFHQYTGIKVVIDVDLLK